MSDARTTVALIGAERYMRTAGGPPIAAPPLNIPDARPNAIVDLLLGSPATMRRAP
jgi:hypothetical protein